MRSVHRPVLSLAGCYSRCAGTSGWSVPISSQLMSSFVGSGLMSGPLPPAIEIMSRSFTSVQMFHTHSFVTHTHNLSHTTLSHTIFHAHIQSFTRKFFTYNFATQKLTRATLSYVVTDAWTSQSRDFILTCHLKRTCDMNNISQIWIQTRHVGALGLAPCHVCRKLKNKMQVHQF